jgi:hypothetical protein
VGRDDELDAVVDDELLTTVYEGDVVTELDELAESVYVDTEDADDTVDVLTE